MNLTSRLAVLSIALILVVFLAVPNISFAICKKPGDIAPDFNLVDIDGNYVKLSDYKGKVVFITFWATWCAKCWEEMDFIKTELESKKDLVILLVNMETRSSSPAHLKKIKKKIKDKKVSSLVLLDLKLEAYDDYCIQSLPSTALVDKKGVIQFAGPHFYKAYKEKITRIIDEELKK